MKEMYISSAQYWQNIDGENIGVVIVTDGKTIHVPIDTNNRHYEEIMRQSKAGELTIREAD
jgi:hypothetical protein